MSQNPFENLPMAYRDLAQTMYALREAVPTLALLASCCVHPRHWIPEEHVRLLKMADQKTSIPSLLQFWMKGLFCLASALYDMLFFAALRVRFNRWLQTLPTHVNILLKTWTTTPTVTSQAPDFYYGSLRQQLTALRQTSLFLTGDGRPDAGTLWSKVKRPFSEWRLIRSIIQDPSRSYVPEWLLVSPTTVLSIAFNQWKTAWTLRRLAQRTSDQKLSQLAAHASLDCLRPFTTKNALQFYVAREAMRRWKASTFVTLYEGRAWEKPAWLGARQAAPHCRLVGYQHTVVLNHSLSLLEPQRSTWVPPAPDVVFCTGESTRNLIQPGHRSFGSRLLVYGSIRRKASLVTAQPRPQRRTVIVLPEGILPECVVVFNAALKAAALLPDHHFIFRCHPILPFSQVEAFLSGTTAALPNIEISITPSIDDDFARSSAILYRGSSSVLYAALQGVKPFYLHDESLPDVDPLFELQGWRENCSSAEDLVTQLKRFETQQPVMFQSSYEDAVKYVDAYTIPVAPDTLKEWLEERTMESVA
jgi:hypothetical protein